MFKLCKIQTLFFFTFFLEEWVIMGTRRISDTLSDAYSFLARATKWYNKYSYNFKSISHKRQESVYCGYFENEIGSSAFGESQSEKVSVIVYTHMNTAQPISRYPRAQKRTFTLRHYHFNAQRLLLAHIKAIETLISPSASTFPSTYYLGGAPLPHFAPTRSEEVSGSGGCLRLCMSLTSLGALSYLLMKR